MPRGARVVLDGVASVAIMAVPALRGLWIATQQRMRPRSAKVVADASRK